MESLVTLGPTSNPAVTHLTRAQVLAWLGVHWATLRTWKEERGFPRPVGAAGAYFYPRAEIDLWRKSTAAPSWVRGHCGKPESKPKAAVFELVA